METGAGVASGGVSVAAAVQAVNATRAIQTTSECISPWTSGILGKERLTVISGTRTRDKEGDLWHDTCNQCGDGFVPYTRETVACPMTLTGFEVLTRPPAPAWNVRNADPGGEEAAVGTAVGTAEGEAHAEPDSVACHLCWP